METSCAPNTRPRHPTNRGSFPPGSTSMENTVTIASAEMEPASDQVSILIKVAPTPTPEPTPTREPTPTPQPTLPDDAGPKAGIFAGMPLIPSILIGFLAVVSTFILVYVGACAQYGSEDEDKCELSRQRIAMVREGVFLIFIVSAILILAIGEGIKEDGAISILSAIVGYVFGREAARSR